VTRRYGGDAISTGREGLQQVHLAKVASKILGGPVAAAFGPPTFFCRSELSPETRIQPNFDRILTHSADLLRRTPTPVGRCACHAIATGSTSGLICASRAGHVLAAIGRHSSGANVAGRRGLAATLLCGG